MALATQSRPRYDLPTAVTFLFFGLALGSVFSVVFSSLKSRPTLSSHHSR